VAPVLALTLAAVVLAPRARRLRATGAWVGALLATGSFWYLRNLLRTGNPLPFADVKLGPLDLPSPPRGLTQNLEFSVAHYIGDTGIWRSHFFPQADFALGPLWWVLVALAAAGAMGAVATRGDRARHVVGLVALACALAYLITPNGAAGREGDPWSFGLNLRYAVSALALSLALLPAWLARDSARIRAALGAVLGGALVVTVFAPYTVQPDRRAGTLAFLAVLALTAAASIALRGRSPRLARRAALGLAGALLVAGWFGQREYERDRYASQPAIVSWARELRDARIGVLGLSDHYQLYGHALTNRVRYVGHDGGRGVFTRLRDCAAWRDALNAGRYRYVVVAPVVSPNLPQGPRTTPPELAWTESDPAASIVTRGQSYAVFRLTGPLSPGGCPGSPRA
jgi:hypothetical protein